MRKGILNIAGRAVGRGQGVFIIAEAGVNHNGSLACALKMVDLAARAGADAVKFQTFRHRDMIVEGVEKAPYQKKNSGAAESQTQMLRRLEIGCKFHEALIRRCRARKIIFLSTPYDEASLRLLLSLRVPALKVSSTDATTPAFLRRIAAGGVPVILSTGMCDLAEIRRAVRALASGGCRRPAILKCTTQYPSDPAEANLRAIRTLESEFPGCVIGFSDHTPGVDVAVLAVAAGAKIVEKHFTLDKSLPGPDHKASLNPAELTALVRGIRACERALGSGKIAPSPTEKKSRGFLRKYLVLVRPLKAGAVLGEDDLAAKRTGGKGIPADRADGLIGRCLVCALGADAVLLPRHLAPRRPRGIRR